MAVTLATIHPGVPSHTTSSQKHQKKKRFEEK